MQVNYKSIFGSFSCRCMIHIRFGYRCEISMYTLYHYEAYCISICNCISFSTSEFISSSLRDNVYLGCLNAIIFFWALETRPFLFWFHLTRPCLFLALLTRPFWNSLHDAYINWWDQVTRRRKHPPPNDRLHWRTRSLQLPQNLRNASYIRKSELLKNINIELLIFDFWLKNNKKIWIFCYKYFLLFHFNDILSISESTAPRQMLNVSFPRKTRIRKFFSQSSPYLWKSNADKHKV